MNMESQMKVISFVNMKGGVGKTTVALNVADCLARVHQKKVAVLDVDPQFNVTQCIFSGDEYVELLKSGADTVLSVFDTEQTSVASVVSGISAAKPKELSEIILQEKDHLHVLLGNIDLYRLEMVSGEGREFALKRFIDQSLGPHGFDYVIVDTPPTPSVWMTSALIASDFYLIPVKPDPLSMIGIDLLRSIIDRRQKSYGLKLKCLGVVFTQVDRPDSIVYHTARHNLLHDPYWKDYLFNPYLPKRSELARFQLEQPYILKMDDFDLRNALQKIVEKILTEIGNG
jgi:chromosome partitioning protein